MTKSIEVERARAVKAEKLLTKSKDAYTKLKQTSEAEIKEKSTMLCQEKDTVVRAKKFAIEMRDRALAAEQKLSQLLSVQPCVKAEHA